MEGYCSAGRGSTIFKANFSPPVKITKRRRHRKEKRPLKCRIPVPLRFVKYFLHGFTATALKS